jgi:hypothetical protein
MNDKKDYSTFKNRRKGFLIKIKNLRVLALLFGKNRPSSPKAFCKKIKKKCNYKILWQLF